MNQRILDNRIHFPFLASTSGDGFMIDASTYSELLREIKTRIRESQVKAAVHVNAALIQLYWRIGKSLHERQLSEGWGTKVLQRLANDLRSELPGQRGFSYRNFFRMLQFYREYSEFQFVPQPVALFPALPGNHSTRTSDENRSSFEAAILQLPWGHNILLISKIKDRSIREWYVYKTAEEGWSRDILGTMVETNAHMRAGKATNNFAQSLPAPYSGLAEQTLKDPYNFDFLTIDTKFREYELESSLMSNLKNFLIELGQGFAFLGNQYPLHLEGREYVIDLLFYHVALRCFIVIDLKTGEFTPEYAGKMNFYCNLVDATLKHSTDSLTIGLILCQQKNRVVAEYTLRGIDTPIGISEYLLTRSLPEKLSSSLPTIEQIENELNLNE